MEKRSKDSESKAKCPSGPAEEAAKTGNDPSPDAASATDSPAAKPKRPDPTRFGDWEKNGRCIDF